MLLLTALIWGVAFVAQRSGMDYIGPLTFQATRSLLGCASLLPILLWQKKRLGARFRMPSLRGAVCCGGVFAVASTLQQSGLVSTPVGKAGFISALYVVLVPVFGLALGKKISLKIGVGAVLALCGLYMLSCVGSFTLSLGELLILCSAALFAVHILVVDHFAAQADGVALSFSQFLVAGLLMLLPALLLEKPTLAQIYSGGWQLLYTGVLSCGVAYTLQILGQQRTPPAVASLTLSLESVFSALSGWVLLHEVMSGRELLGALLVMLAVVISQLPGKK